MCGRFTLTTPGDLLAELFRLLQMPVLPPRYNIAPTQPVEVVRAGPGRGRRTIAPMRWGLIPSWSKSPAAGAPLINARSETVATRPAFRAAFRRRRCLIPADGFYEWGPLPAAPLPPRAALPAQGDLFATPPEPRPSGRRVRPPRKGSRQPHYIRRRDGRPFAFAGLWERWEGPDGSALETCAIVTTEANTLLRPLHDRMPVIVAPRDYDRWLDPKALTEELMRSIFRPYPAETMTAHPVGPWVNSVSREDPRCAQPADT